MPSDVAARYLEDVIEQFRKQKNLADRALAQVDDNALFVTPDPDSNSLALIMKHLGGNMRSRWTDFLTSDGEKPDRRRDREFEILGGDDKAGIFGVWETGWRCVFDSLASLGPGDLLKDVYIRGERHTVMQAIDRGLTHAAYHVGQIVYLAKHLSADRWRSLSIPKGQSEDFNKRRSSG